MAEKKKSAPVSSGPVKPEDKKKALETALAQIEKNFGKGAIMRLGDDIPVNVEANILKDHTDPDLSFRHSKGTACTTGLISHFLGDPLDLLFYFRTDAAAVVQCSVHSTS